MVNLECAKNTLTKKAWENLSHYEKYAYLKTFVMWVDDESYKWEMKRIDDFLNGL